MKAITAFSFALALAFCIPIVQAGGANETTGLAETALSETFAGFHDRLLRRTHDSAGFKWGRVVGERPPGGWATENTAWARLLQPLRETTGAELIDGVHRLFKTIPYASDRSLWGKSDHWATPQELLAAGAGDCEDIAIASYFALRELGFPDNALRLVVVVDVMSGGRPHAILQVFHEGRVTILDSLRPGPGIAADAARYRPVYAVNEESFWVYVHHSPAIS